MLKDLITTDAKLRQYYAKIQDSLNLLYEKVALLSSNKKRRHISKIELKDIQRRKIMKRNLLISFRKTIFRRVSSRIRF
jgi:hypothetical protein